MPRFKIHNNNESQLSDKWVPATKFDSKNRVVDAEGNKISSDYKGHKYLIFDKREYTFSRVERVGRGFLGTIAVVFTLGLALFSRSITGFFTRAKKNMRFAKLLPDVQSKSVSPLNSANLGVPSINTEEKNTSSKIPPQADVNDATYLYMRTMNGPITPTVPKTALLPDVQSKSVSPLNSANLGVPSINTEEKNTPSKTPPQADVNDATYLYMRTMNGPITLTVPKTATTEEIIRYLADEMDVKQIEKIYIGLDYSLGIKGNCAHMGNAKEVDEVVKYKYGHIGKIDFGLVVINNF